MRERKKILMTADTVGGVWTFSLELIKAFDPSLYQFYLATMGLPLNEDQKQQISHLPHLQVIPSSYKLEWMQDPWSDLEKSNHWLLNLEHELAPDIIHLNNFVHGSLPWQAPAFIVGHSCVFSWWESVKQGEVIPAHWELYKEKVGQGLRSVQKVVGVSNFMLQKLEQFYGPLKGTEVIYNGLSSENFFQDYPKENFLFAMGRIWDEAKNLSLLGSIAPSLPWSIKIAGNNQHPGGSTNCKISNVDLLGPLPPQRIKEYLSKASIFVHPAIYEPFGLGVLEAALSSCALLLSDIPSHRELWQDAALFFNPRDPFDLENKIKFLISESQIRGHYSHLAFERAQQYSLTKMVHHYQNLYKELIQASHRQ